MAGRKGFVIILVTSLMGILIITAWVLIDLGCNEALETKKRNDFISANYVAVAGAERMYAYLKSLSGKSVIFPVIRPAETITINGSAIGTFTARTYIINNDTDFGIISEGVVNGQKSTITVKYGYKSPLTTPPTLGCGNNLTLAGYQDPNKPKKISYVSLEGPLFYGNDINKGNFVNITGDVVNQPISPVNFWVHQPFDTMGTNVVFSDGGTGKVTEEQAIAQCGTNDRNDPRLSTFYRNDVNGDLVIDEKDAFIYYYIAYLNSPTCPANTTGQYLNISPNDIGKPGCHYYQGDQEFNPKAVPKGTPIIFVDGDVFINRSDTKWWGDSYSHTVVATGNITIVQPKDGSDDSLTLVAFGDVITGGKDVGGQIKGNLMVWAKNDFIAEYGGVTNTAVVAENDMTIETLNGKNPYDRTINPYKGDWVAPLGLPPGYPMASTNFRIMTETVGVGGYRPIWQRR